MARLDMAAEAEQPRELSLLERYWTEPAFREEYDADHRAWQASAHASIDRGCAQLRQRRLDRWAREEAEALAKDPAERTAVDWSYVRLADEAARANDGEPM